MESLLRKALRRNDYNRHKLLRLIKRRNKAKREQEQLAAEKELRKKLRMPKYDFGKDVVYEEPFRQRVTPRPKLENANRNQRWKQEYDKSIAIELANHEAAKKRDEESSRQYDIKLQKRIEDSDKLFGSLYRAQDAMNQEAESILSSGDIQLAADDLVERERQNFERNKQYWKYVIQSIGAIADASVLGSLYGVYKKQKSLNYTIGQISQLQNSGQWGFLFDLQLNNLIILRDKLTRQLNSPNIVQSVGGAVGAGSNAAQILTGNGDMIDVFGTLGGASSLVGGSNLLRGTRFGNMADNAFDYAGVGLQGIDLSKTLFEMAGGDTGNIFMPLDQIWSGYGGILSRPKQNNE